MKRENQSLGLTLIELLIAIAIVGIISAIGYNLYDDGRKKARDVQRKNHLKDIQIALELYYDDYNRYPPGNTGGPTVYSSLSYDAADPWISGLDQYMRKVPRDPINTSVERFYHYQVYNTRSVLPYNDELRI